jgi:hypothetical protein
MRSGAKSIGTEIVPLNVGGKKLIRSLGWKSKRIPVPGGLLDLLLLSVLQINVGETEQLDKLATDSVWIQVGRRTKQKLKWSNRFWNKNLNSLSANILLKWLEFFSSWHWAEFVLAVVFYRDGTLLILSHFSNIFWANQVSAECLCEIFVRKRAEKVTLGVFTHRHEFFIRKTWSAASHWRLSLGWINSFRDDSTNFCETLFELKKTLKDLTARKKCFVDESWKKARQHFFVKK